MMENRDAATDVVEERGEAAVERAGLESVPAAYRAMDRREALKVMVQP